MGCLMGGAKFGPVPSSVEVVALEIGAVVAGTDTIGVHHGHDLYFIIFAEEVAFLVLP